MSADLLAGEAATFAQLVTHRFPLSKVAEAFETAADSRFKTLRVLVQPEKNLPTVC